MRKDKIGSLWPIYGDSLPFEDTNVMKLNHTGTHPVAADLAISDAIDFHNMIGTQRTARLRYLQNYWTNKVRGMSCSTRRPIRSSVRHRQRRCHGFETHRSRHDVTDYKIFTAGVDNACGRPRRGDAHVFIPPQNRMYW